MSGVLDLLQATKLHYSQDIELQWISDPNEYLYEPGSYDPAAASESTKTGISVRDAIVAHIDVRARMEPNVRTCIITLDPATFVANEDYEFDISSPISGAANVIGNGATLEAAAESLAAAVNAAYSDPEDPVATVADLGSGRENSVIIRQTASPTGFPPDMTITTITFSSTNTATVYFDAGSCDLRIWAKRKRSAGVPAALPMPWLVPGTQGGLLGPGVTSWSWGDVADEWGVSLLRDVRGYDRIYVQLYNITPPSGTFAAGVIFRPYLIVGTSVLTE